LPRFGCCLWRRAAFADRAGRTDVAADEAAARRVNGLMRSSWTWRGQVALTAVVLAFVLYPISEPGAYVINSDWPAFATGAKVALTDPAHLYDLALQERVQLEVTGGARLITPGIHGILPFLDPAWIAAVPVPSDLLR